MSFVVLFCAFLYINVKKMNPVLTFSTVIYKRIACFFSCTRTKHVWLWYGCLEKYRKSFIDAAHIQNVCVCVQEVK